jgi:oxygen-dependent protoporphyrinogen oxidase
LFTTLKNGLQSLVDALIEHARPEIVHGSVDRIEKGWRVRVAGDWIECDHVVVACRPAAVLPDLFPAIQYNSGGVIAVGYRRTDIKTELDGSGFLVPRVERRDISACTWVPRKFDFRVPEDKILIRLFTTGGSANWRDEVREKLGITAEPLFVQEYRWPESMPQYNVGHTELVKLIREMLADLPGLHLVGNAYDGVGIPDCIRMAKDVAQRITTYATPGPTSSRSTL